MKKIIVACAGAVATSTIACEKIREIANKNKIHIDIIQCRISEIEEYLEDAQFILTTSRVKKDYDIPLYHGMPFISGIGTEELELKIINELKK